MQLGVEAALAALAYAAVNEQEGYRFYMRVAEHVRDAKGKALFRGLAEDEVKHYHILMAEHQSLAGGGSWLSLEQALAAAVPAIDEFEPRVTNVAGAAVPQERLFPQADEAIAAIDAGTGDLAAVDMALTAEKRGYDIYRKAAREATDANARAAYELLMAEEDRHYEWLRQSRSYLASNETYWDDSELPFFEG